MFVRHTVPLPNWRVLGKGLEGKSGGEENGQWKEEGIICYCKIIPVHVLVNHQHTHWNERNAKKTGDMILVPF